MEHRPWGEAPTISLPDLVANPVRPVATTINNFADLSGVLAQINALIAAVNSMASLLNTTNGVAQNTNQTVENITIEVGGDTYNGVDGMGVALEAVDSALTQILAQWIHASEHADLATWLSTWSGSTNLTTAGALNATSVSAGSFTVGTHSGANFDGGEGGFQFVGGIYVGGGTATGSGSVPDVPAGSGKYYRSGSRTWESLDAWTGSTAITTAGALSVTSLTTTGAVSTGALTASSITTSGALSAGSATLGATTASSINVSGAATVGSLTISSGSLTTTSISTGSLAVTGGSAATFASGINVTGAIGASGNITTANDVYAKNLQLSQNIYATGTIAGASVTTTTLNTSNIVTGGTLSVTGGGNFSGTVVAANFTKPDGTSFLTWGDLYAWNGEGSVGHAASHITKLGTVTDGKWAANNTAIGVAPNGAPYIAVGTPMLDPGGWIAGMVSATYMRATAFAPWGTYRHITMGNETDQTGGLDFDANARTLTIRADAGGVNLSGENAFLSVNGTVTADSFRFSDGTDTFSGATLTGPLVFKGGLFTGVNASPAPSLMGFSSSSAMAAWTLAGTNNRIIVSLAGSTLTLSTPQDLHSTAAVSFASLTLTGALICTSAKIGTADVATQAWVTSALGNYNTKAQDTAILNNYATTAAMNTALQAYATTAAMTTALAGKANVDPFVVYNSDGPPARGNARLNSLTVGSITFQA